MSDCPDPDILNRFSRGLTIENFDAVCHHVTECSKCAEKIDLGNAATESWIVRARDSARHEADGFTIGARIGRAGELMVVRKVGYGGMAQVWQAYQPDLDRFWAVKISRNSQSAAVLRLAEEAKVLAGVSHPNIVAVHDFFQQDGKPVIVMDFIDGRNLSQRFDSANSTAEMIFNWAEQLLAALCKLHAEGITHGDLKPSNLLVDWKENLYLADFGLSTSSGSQAPKVFAGTLQYAAPEQATSATDSRSDIYSLGKILQDLARFARRVAASQTAAPSERSSLHQLASDLENTAEQCIRENPNERTPVQELIQLLHSFKPQPHQGHVYIGKRWFQFGLLAISAASLMVVAWAYLCRPSDEYVRLFVRSYTNHEVDTLRIAFERAGLKDFEYIDGDFWVPKTHYYDFFHKGAEALRSDSFDDEKLINRLFDLSFESSSTEIRVILDTDHQTKIGSAEEALSLSEPIVSGIEIVHFHPNDAIKVLQLTSKYRLKQFYFESGYLQPMVARLLVQQAAIRECYISDCRIEDQFVEILSNSTSLNDFFSINNPITDESIKYLCRMPQLGAVGLRGAQGITGRGLRNLHKLETLRLLEITEGIPQDVIDEFTSSGVDVFVYDFPAHGERAKAK